MNGQIELREDPGGTGKLTLEGYASRTETPYEFGPFTETIARGAFKRSLKDKPDTSLLVNHEGLPIARTTTGTLALAEDHNGLHVRAELEPEDPDVQAIAWKMRRGDLSEMSMGFRATKQDWSPDKTERLIREVALHRGDVSIVSSAASPTSTATLRSMEATLEQRNRLAERIGDRLCGPTGFTFSEESVSAARGRSQIAVPRSVTRRSHLELAKAYAAKGGGERRSDTSPFGDFWVIKTSRDVMKAVRQVELGRAKGKEASVKAWIIKRAEALGCSDLIPKTNWSAAPAAVGSGAGR